MAKAAWCTVTPTSGKENGTINISATRHTGRSVRNTTVVVQAKNGTKPSTSIAINQVGASVATTMDASKPDAPATTEVVTINGTSNSSKLNWALKGAMFGADINLLPLIANEIKVNNVAITNNVAIAGDPGATAQYNFVATLTFTAFKPAIDVPITFTVTDESGASKTCTFVRKASSSSIAVNKASLSLVNDGTVQAVTVTSNDEWEIS